MVRWQTAHRRERNLTGLWRRGSEMREKNGHITYGICTSFVPHWKKQSLLRQLVTVLFLLAYFTPPLYTLYDLSVDKDRGGREWWMMSIKMLDPTSSLNDINSVKLIDREMRESRSREKEVWRNRGWWDWKCSWWKAHAVWGKNVGVTENGPFMGIK